MNSVSKTLKFSILPKTHHPRITASTPLSSQQLAAKQRHPHHISSSISSFSQSFPKRSEGETRKVVKCKPQNEEGGAVMEVHRLQSIPFYPHENEHY